MAGYLNDLAIVVQSLRDYPRVGEIAEHGETFIDNALHKARSVFQNVGGYVLADDSGLVCEDLGGAPGVYSARYAGSGASDGENNRKLVAEIALVHDPCRRAEYQCALVLIDPKGRETVIEESCEGAITLTPSGHDGFGYDPHFYLPDQDRTMAELSVREKNAISHRGKAMGKMREILIQALGTK